MSAAEGSATLGQHVQRRPWQGRHLRRLSSCSVKQTASHWPRGHRQCMHNPARRHSRRPHSLRGLPMIVPDSRPGPPMFLPPKATCAQTKQALPLRHHPGPCSKFGETEHRRLCLLAHPPGIILLLTVAVVILYHAGPWGRQDPPATASPRAEEPVTRSTIKTSRLERRQPVVQAIFRIRWLLVHSGSTSGSYCVGPWSPMLVSTTSYGMGGQRWFKLE